MKQMVRFNHVRKYSNCRLNGKMPIKASKCTITLHPTALAYSTSSSWVTSTTGGVQCDSRTHIEQWGQAYTIRESRTSH